MEEFWEMRQSASRWISRLGDCPAVHRKRTSDHRWEFLQESQLNSIICWPAWFHPDVVAKVFCLDLLFTQRRAGQGVKGCRLHGGARGKRKLLIAKTLDKQEGIDLMGNLRGSVQRLAGLTLSSESPAHISVWRVFGKVGLRGSSHHFSIIYAEHLHFFWESGILVHPRQRCWQDQPSVKPWMLNVCWAPHRLTIL